MCLDVFWKLVHRTFGQSHVQECMKAEYETDFKWLNLCDMDPDFVKGSGDLLLLLRLYRVFHSMSSSYSFTEEKGCMFIFHPEVT